jgi:hypothetical protein
LIASWYNNSGKYEHPSLSFMQRRTDLAKGMMHRFKRHPWQLVAFWVLLIGVSALFRVTATELLAQSIPTPATVRPGSLGDPLAPPLERWGPSNQTSGSAAIGTTWPRGTAPDQLGALELQSGSGEQRAEIQYFWSLETYPDRTLGAITALSFDWLRASSSTAAPDLVPALRLYYTNGPGELGILTWERRYNAAGPAPTDAWNSAGLLNDVFWMQRLDLGQPIERYDISLAEWISGAEITDPNGRPAHILNAETRILAIGVTVGPNWEGAFDGAIDNILLRFGADDTVSANFEPDAPGFGSTPPPTSTLNLGSVLVSNGQLSATLQISETRNLTLTVGSPQISGPHAADFSITPAGAFELIDGAAARTLTITCNPSATGLRSATLSMATNDPILPEARYTLNCTGTQPGFGSVPPPGTPIELGNAPPGNDTPVVTLQLNSIGSATLAITPTLSGDPQISVDTATPMNLAPGASATMSFRCRPERAGEYRATLSLATSDPARPIGTYALRCGGLVSRIFLPAVEFARGPDLVVEQITVAPSTDLASTTPIVISVTIRNQGDTATVNDFWVDLYINPSRRPLPHDLWYRLCPEPTCVGLAWPVTQRLGPGEQLTISSAAGFEQRQSRWSGFLPAGEVQIYAQADSWNTAGSAGNIPEQNELNNVGEFEVLTVR